MEKQDVHKKPPLHSSQQNSSTDVEEKVDHILDAHSSVLEQKKQDKPLEPSSSADEKEKAKFFYVGNKKKNQVIPTVTKEKKSVSIKKKKHLGFKSKKNDKTPLKTKQNIPKKTQGSEEELLKFQESVVPIKTEEAAWLNQQIKAKMEGEKNNKPTLKEPVKEDSVQLEESTIPLQSSHPIEKLGETKREEIPSPSNGEATILEPEPAQATVVTTPIQETQSTGSESPEIKIEEITPDGQIRFLKEANQLKAYTLNRMGYSENSVEEIDFYPIYEPFAYVEIIREKESLDKRYVLLEMQLSKEEEYLLKFIKETLDGFIFKTTDLETKGEDKYLSEKVDLIIEDYMLNIDSLTKKKILYYLEKESIGLGKLEVIMKDPNIEDISCDGSGVFIFLYHRRYGSLKSNVQFNDEDELTAFVVKLAQKCGKHISISEPMLDATMPDGSRIQMTLSTEVTTKGSTFTIRKFSEDPFSPPDLIEFHTMSSEMVAYMWLAVENGINALIAGGTAAGKTSTLNALCLFIPRESKIVTIEETREINLPHPNWIPGVVRSGFGEVVGNKVIGEIDLYDLMKAALRQRPEYILVGEIRGKEAYVLFQAMATGHTTYSTVHADSAQSLIHRLEGKPIEIPRIMLQTLDIVIIQVISRVKNKRARRCKQIIEIIDIDPTTKEILTNEVFRWDPIEDKFVYSGKSYILERIRAEKDISREGMITEIKNRTMLLDWMNKNNIREFKKVATIIAQYTDNSTEVMKKIRNE